jgi:hypothetical protein
MLGSTPPLAIHGRPAGGCCKCQSLPALLQLMQAGRYKGMPPSPPPTKLHGVTCLDAASFTTAETKAPCRCRGDVPLMCAVTVVVVRRQPHKTLAGASIAAQRDLVKCTSGQGLSSCPAASTPIPPPKQPGMLHITIPGSGTKHLTALLYVQLLYAMAGCNTACCMFSCFARVTASTALWGSFQHRAV